MLDAQYEQYKNIHIFATEWRNFIHKGKLLNKDEFKKNMQYDNYVISNYMDPETQKPVYIYLLMKDSKISTTQEIKKILNSIKKISIVMLITDNEFSSHINKMITTYKNLTIYCYRHYNFSMIIPLAPLAGKHRILSKEEVNQLINEDLMISIHNLPKIYIDNPQCIWVGAKVGNVIEIISPSYINHEYRTYKVVIPSPGKIIISREKDKPKEVIKEEKIDTKLKIKKRNSSEEKQDDLDDIEEPEDYDESQIFEDAEEEAEEPIEEDEHGLADVDGGDVVDGGDDDHA